MTDTKAQTARIEQILHEASLPAEKRREKRETNYLNVCWHVAKGKWRVQVYRQANGKQYKFYKAFFPDQEDTAAWVADAAGLLMKGKDALYLQVHKGHLGKEALNYCWENGIPECPDPNITIYTVYEWLQEKGVPCAWRPSSIHVPKTRH